MGDSSRKGGCQCGAVRYELSGDPMHHALCHCNDCRASAGAPMVGWAMYVEDALAVTGKFKTFESSEHGRRSFCPKCGTGLFYRNAENLPGIVDIQSGSLDDPSELPAQSHIQTAERLDWMKQAHELPEFERFPEG